MQPEPSPQIQQFDDSHRIKRCRQKPEDLSLNQIYKETMGSSCGYCNKKSTSFSWSFEKKKMDSYTYELLTERGWRRCGTYYYKPNLVKSCCKLWTHRLEANKFKPKRDQKKAIKRVIMIAYDKIETMEIQSKSTNHKNQGEGKGKNNKNTQVNQKAQVAQLKEEVKLKLEQVCGTIVNYLRENMAKLIKSTIVDQAVLEQFSYQIGGKLKFFNSRQQDHSDYYSNFVMLVFGINKKLFGSAKYGLIDFARDVKEGVEGLSPVNGFKLEVERGGYLFFKRNDNTTEFQILAEKKESKMDVEEPEKKEEASGLSNIISKIKNKFKKEENKPASSSTLEQLKMQDKHSSNFQILKPEHQYKGEINISHNKITFGKLTVQVVKAEQNVQSFKIYQEYCTKIHGKAEKSMSSYVNFLCLQALDYRTQDSTIKNEDKQEYIPSWDPECKHQKPKKVQGEVKKLLGCYHMKYYFKGKLIGIGVVDMMDDGLSSVYYFYDPKYKEYRLGVFSSIIEIEYVRWMRLSFPQFRYYYMGFYVADTDKMNYKVDYMPCQLLCPVTYKFVDFNEEVKDRIERIVKGEEKDIKLAGEDIGIIDDMDFGKTLGPHIDKTLKLMYNGRKLVLKQINPAFFVNILKILDINVRVYGKKLFDILTFTL